jgi:hypothetical protein
MMILETNEKNLSMVIQFCRVNGTWFKRSRSQGRHRFGKKAIWKVVKDLKDEQFFQKDGQIYFLDKIFGKVSLKKRHINPTFIKVNDEYIFPYSIDTEFEILEG